MPVDPSAQASVSPLRKTRFLPLLLLCLLSLIWGTSYILIKRGLVALPPDEVGPLRVVSAFVFLLPFSLPRLRRVSLGVHVRLWASGMMGIFIPAFLFSIAQTHITSSLSGILNSMTPVWSMLIGIAVSRQAITVKVVVGTLLGFGGVAWLIVSNSQGGLGAAVFNFYALLPIIAAFLYGVNVNFIKYRLHELDAISMTSLSTFVIGIMAAMYLLGATDFMDRLISGTTPGIWLSFWAVVWLGLMSTAVAIILMNQLIKISDPLYASMSTYLSPIVAVMWGLADGERLNPSSIIGVVGIVVGIYLSRKR